MDAVEMVSLLLDRALKHPSGEEIRIFGKNAESLSQTEVDSLDGMNDALMRGFFEAATDGFEFVPRERIVERFGGTLAGNYPEAGPTFLRMANTYWTLKLALSDLSAQDSTAAQVLLTNLESTIGALFFPTPGPLQIDPERRKQDQRAILTEMAPRMDLEDFLSHNPILHRDRITHGTNSGCLVAPLILGKLLSQYLGGGGA